MKSRLMVPALLTAAILTAQASTVLAYYKTTSGTKTNQPVTAYLGTAGRDRLEQTVELPLETAQ
jgi:hypothetical protein